MGVNGLYGWVARNNARSTAFLLAFALLTQPMAMVVLFVPLVFIDPAHAPWYAWSGYGVRYAPIVAVTAVVYFAVQMRRDVKMVRAGIAFRIVDPTSEPRLCALAEPLAIATGLAMIRLGVVEKSEMNAFACGAARTASVVVVTRGLVDNLDDDELSAVLAHELAHVRNGDTRVIAAANVFMRSMLLLDSVNLFKPKRYRQIASLLVAPVLFPVYLVVALLTQFCVRLGHASRYLISSAREFVADAEAIRLTQDPAALVSALRRIESYSAIAGLPPEQDAMMIVAAGCGTPSTHPPVGMRIDAIVAVTGAMALEARPRRDTRSAFQRSQAVSRRGGLVPEAWTPNETRRLARIAARATVPRQSSFESVVRVGEDGALGVFGLRWDMAAAMLATFCAALVLHHGDLIGFMGQMGHALDRPDGHKGALVSQAVACRNSQVRQLLGDKAQAASTACMPSATWSAHAAELGLHLLGDGRLLNDSQQAMLSPDELEESTAQPFDPAPLLHKRAPRPVTDLAPSYPLPLHEAWMRLAGGDLHRYLKRSQCGVLIHARVSTEPDQSVVWSIISEGEERVRFTATLEPLGARETRVSLTIDDFQPTRRVFDADTTDARGQVVKDLVGEPVVFRPALSPPLRPAFAEAMSAMLAQRLFQADRVHEEGAYLPGDGMTGGICGNQFERLRMQSERFSIHDPADRS